MIKDSGVCPLIVAREIQNSLNELSYKLIMESIVDTKNNRERIVNDLINGVIERASKLDTREIFKQPLMIEDKTKQKVI